MPRQPDIDRDAIMDLVEFESQMERGAREMLRLAFEPYRAEYLKLCNNNSCRDNHKTEKQSEL